MTPFAFADYNDRLVINDLRKKAIGIIYAQ